MLQFYHKNIEEMKSIFLSSWLAIAILLLACNTNKDSISQSKNTEKMEQLNAKKLVVKGMKALFTDYSAKDASTYFAKDYIQHNPNIPTGIEPVIGFLPGLKAAGTSYKTHRIFQDGEYVVLHNTYDNAEAFGAPQIVTFDVFRVEDGKLAEHWDAVNPIVEKTVSGRTQVDGPTEVTDLDQTAANKTLVKNFVDDILFGKNPTKITEYVSSEKYHQHNTAIGDGLEGLGKALEYLAAQNDMFQYKTVHKVLGEGNFVLTISEGEWHGKPQSFYDLFRIENGKIVEHWDVVQEIPAKMAHNNGMF